MREQANNSKVVLFSEEEGIVGSKWSPVQMIKGDLENMGYLSGAFSSAEDLEDALANADQSIAAVMIEGGEKEALSMLSLVDRLHKTYPDMGVMLSFDAEEGTRTEGAISYRIIKRPGWHIAVEEHIRTNTERWAQSEWRFSYPSEEGVSTISPADILYLTVEGGDGAKALTRNGMMTLGNTLSYWEEKTALLGFVRVHRSYLVNVRYIRSVTDREIVMAFDGEDIVGNTITIPYSSRRYKEVLMNRINSLFPREDNP